MDKTEYQIKLDEINRLVDLQEYEDALEIVDSIEWKRVKSVRTLCMVAEIYEINGELEDSMRILQMAYKRSSVGKTILYRQVELSLKMKKYDDAVKYYNKYLEAASNDTSKYILKYKIYKAQKAPLEDLIMILEEYKEREYTERWVYELAKLYKQADNQRKCVETCDDLILWFGEGKYVTKAMELKMTYVPLSPSQKIKYEQRHRWEENSLDESAEKKAAKTGNKAADKAVSKPVAPVVQPKVQPAITPAKLEGISEAAMANLQKYPSFLRQDKNVVAAAAKKTAEPMEEAAVTSESVKTPTVPVETLPEHTVEKSTEIEIPAVAQPDPEVEEPVEKETTIIVEPEENVSVKVEAVEEAKAEETPVVEDVPTFAVDPAELQKNLAKSLEQVFSGLHRAKMVNAFEQLGKSSGSEIPQEILDEENMDEYLMTDLAPENMDQNIISVESEPEKRMKEDVRETENSDDAFSKILEKISLEVEESIKEEVQAEDTQPEVVADEVEENKTEMSEAEAVSEPVIDIDGFDLEALFAETSSGFAKMAEEMVSEETEEELKEPVVEEVEEEAEEPVSEETEEELKEPVVEKVEEEAEEPVSEETEEEAEEPVVEEVEEEAEEPVVEEVEEEAEEPVVEETEEEAEELASEETKEELKEPEWKETWAGDEMDAAAAMLAFEQSLLEDLNNIPGLENYRPEEFIEEITEEPAEEIAEEPVEAVAEEPAEAVAEEPVEAVVEELAEAVAEEPAEAVAEEPVEAVAEELAETVAEEPAEAVAEEPAQEIVDEFVNKAAENDPFDLEIQIMENMESLFGENKEEQKPEEEMDLVERLMMEADNESSTYQSLAGETPEDKRRRIFNSTCQDKLTEEQKALFSYFCKVPGMNEQILDAINGVYKYADEKTSRRGNIAIMGKHGTGKTRLGEGLVKAICKEFGIEATKYACIDALDMNTKDIATVVGKMSGGFLMIERAHLLNEATIEQLSKAMEFRTDSMVLIIEDEKTEMRQFLAENPTFAEKFETVISIPVFTNDELVTFARTYAKENGFKMDELGVLALYALIGDNQRENEPITVAGVKSMVDRAIRHANNARLGRRISKRHVDEDGRILLYEKDFDF